MTFSFFRNLFSMIFFRDTVDQGSKTSLLMISIVHTVSCSPHGPSVTSGIKMAGLRPNSESIGNFGILKNFLCNLVHHSKSSLHTNFEVRRR